MIGRERVEAGDPGNLAWYGSQLLEWHDWTVTADQLPPLLDPCWKLRVPRGHESYIMRAESAEDVGAFTPIDAWQEFFARGQVDNPAVNLIQCVALLSEDVYQIYYGTRSQYVTVNGVRVDVDGGHPQQLAAALCRAWWESING